MILKHKRNDNRLKRMDDALSKIVSHGNPCLINNRGSHDLVDMMKRDKFVFVTEDDLKEMDKVS